MVNRWLLMEIGCLECGYTSDALGTFPTPEAALEVGGEGTKLRSEMDGGIDAAAFGDWHGDGVRVVFDLEAVAGASGTPGGTGE